jgi:hypothetical protein
VIILLQMALANTAAVVVGSDRIDDERSLRYADDDAWRAAYLLAPSVDRLVVLAEPDESTRDRDWPALDGAPTASALVDAIGDVLTDEPDQVVLFLAAHGTSERITLADGEHDFAALRARIQGLLDDDDQLLLIGDVCLSARWRGDSLGVVQADGPVFPPVDPSVNGNWEVVVDSVTPEDEALAGGVFSYLVLSGLMGAADANGDGSVDAQELSDFVHSYAAGSRVPFIPVVRSPDGPDAHLPWQARGLQLQLAADEPTRWVVALEDGPIVAEAFTAAGESRALTLPAGSYRVLELPCKQQGSPVWRTTGHGREHALELRASGPLEGAGSAFTTGWYRGQDLDVVALPLDGPVSPPRHEVRYHPVDGLVGAGPLVERGAFVDGGVQLGMGVGWTGWTSQPARPWVSTSGSRELAPDQAQTWQLTALAGWERDLVHRRRWMLSTQLGAGASAIRVVSPRVVQAAVAPTARLGISGSLWTDQAILRLQLNWDPALLPVDDETGVRLQPDADRVGVSLLVMRPF